MIKCIFVKVFVVCVRYVSYSLVEVVIYNDFDINANRPHLNKLAWPILPHLWDKMGYGWGKLDINQL